jgi:uncharacterized protein (DUF1684 family)
VNALELADWRQRVAALYLSDVDIHGFRAARADLFRTHAQSPVPPGSAGPRYFDPDPAYIAEVTIESADGTIDIDTGGPDGVVRYERVGNLATPWGPLMLWWIQAYGGGLFLPFRDGTCGHETYGGGRYLTDTVKGTHGRGVEWLGGGRIRLDFNYAYNPSCAYSEEWLCPLAPPENRVSEEIRAGELTYEQALADF